ncbi:TPA: hypothetical protein L4734_006724 [Pseudomonas aeruginosa]|uniref:hypothetical protein n=2 Tax=Pseudomonas aeruginosa TaxID=287 RepID=UPI0021F16014|nr:hypothetical protein [Pseudomonas aeruginosa]MCV4082549.1 hypothetical protein [Pseudomonas aeruginosa]HBO6231835.1 hypothetical protein [Pseudomonas aeruginosa]
MNKANECTCPSGDGSLVHPCPAHPAVEQAGGDERAAFNRWIAEQQLCQGSDISLFKLERNGALVSLHELLRDAYQAGQDRAALAQPSPAQAEAERPEVVGYRSKESGMVYEQDYGLKNPEALTTVAECERIVGALRADRDSWAEQAEQRLAYWDEMRKERDAALARVAELEAKLVELEKQEPNVSAMARILSDRTATVCNVDADDHWQLYGDEIIADVNAMMEAHPYYADPVAQAQHSVPEVSGIGRDFAYPRSVVLYLRTEPTDDDLRAIHDALRSLAAAPGKEVPQAWLDVQAERRRQVEAEGWTPEHDDLYCAAELPRAAAAYILNGANDEAPAIWPFSAKWWKPRDARSNYVRASALILAEIERLDRAAPGKEGV